MLFALIDCNNFYVSCERVFNPSLIGKPVIILSNNDGCVIARSNESKALGITMGALYHQIQALIKRYGVVVHSSNFALYGDMSQRVMQLLGQQLVDLEIYSIDEAFAQIDDSVIGQPAAYCQYLRQWIYRCTGIPISIGLAATKVLAKLANHTAKKQSRSGVFYLHKPAVIEKLLQNTAVDILWGIGSRLAIRLRQLGVETAWQLQQMEDVSQHFNRLVQSVVWELRGRSCLALEELQAPKSIMTSRSFGQPVTELSKLSEAISHYATAACAKARRHQRQAQAITIFLQTNGFAVNKAQYRNQITLALDHPSNDTTFIISQAKQALAAIYRSGYQYKKVGILLHELAEVGVQQLSFLMEPPSPRRQACLITVDDLNQRYGRDTIFFRGSRYCATVANETSIFIVALYDLLD